MTRGAAASSGGAARQPNLWPNSYSLSWVVAQTYYVIGMIELSIFIRL